MTELELGQHQQCDPRPPCALRSGARSDHAPQCSCNNSFPAHTLRWTPREPGADPDVDAVDQNLMPTLWFIAGVGVSSSSACGLVVRASRCPVHSGRRPHPLSPGTLPCFNTILKVFVLVFVLASNASSSALSISFCLLLVRVL